MTSKRSSRSPTDAFVLRCEVVPERVAAPDAYQSPSRAGGPGSEPCRRARGRVASSPTIARCQQAHARAEAERQRRDRASLSGASKIATDSASQAAIPGLKAEPGVLTVPALTVAAPSQRRSHP